MIFIAIGSNLSSKTYGSALGACEYSIHELEQHRVKVVKKSHWYETKPIPESKQPNFINGLVSVETELTSSQLLALLHEIEAQMGRKRSVENAARIIDLDLIAYHTEIVESDVLTLPHPRMTKRAFVAAPIADIAPDWCHPISGQSITEILAALLDQKITRVSD